MKLSTIKSSALNLALTLMLFGCSTFSPYRIGSQQEINQWVENNQYGIAISALVNKERLFPTKAGLDSLTVIKAKAAKYDKVQAATILKLLSHNKWDEALSTLHSSLQNYPNGKHLKIAQKIIQRRQAKNTLNLEAQLLIKKAEWLSQNLKIYRNMLLVDPQNRSTKWDMENTQSEVRLTAAKLHAFGQNSLHKKQYDLAEVCLHTANRLHPTKEYGASLMLLEQKNQKPLMDKMKLVIEQNKLEDGQKLLAQIEAMKEHPLELVKLRNVLSKKITDEVNKILEEGSVFYKNGNLEQARQIWQKALKLDPNNKQIHDRISRSEKALETLKDLKKEEHSK